MQLLNEIKGIDIYLLDQILKGRIASSSKVLDAGCGSGRNIHFLINNGFNVTGIDPNKERIDQLKANYQGNFEVSTIEDYTTNHQFDFIICNAVLHFAESHDHFDRMFKSLIGLLAEDGILFIRMTSEFAVSTPFNSDENGIAILPDGSTRYLLSEAKLDQVIDQYEIGLIEPVKTVNVDDLRCMTTLVIRKLNSI